MECPECQSSHIRKNGIKRGKQNHICMGCGRQFVVRNETPNKYSDEFKRDFGDHSAKTFEPLWAIVATWQCFFYVTDGWSVYPAFIPTGDQIQ